MLILAVVAVFVAVICAALAVAAPASPRRAVRATLRNVTVGDPVLLVKKPLARAGTRLTLGVLGRVIHVIGSFAQRVSPAAYTKSVRRRLVLADRGRPEDLDRFFAERTLTLALVPVALVLVELSSLSKPYGLATFLVIALLLILGPDAILSRQSDRRQAKILAALPGFMDLLLISVEAGLGFEQALSRAVAALPGPLSDEFSRFLSEVQMGAVRKNALEEIEQRTDVPELRSFLLALMQADTFGISIVNILRAQAGEVRIAQRQHVQERAQKAPVKMIFPLVFCVMPALFVVVIGPAVLEVYRTIIK